MKNELRIVGTFNYVDGKFVTVEQNSNKKRFQEHLPVVIPSSQLSQYYPLKTHSEVPIGGLLNKLKLRAGLSLPSIKGKRIVLEATKQRVIFAEVDYEGGPRIPTIYIQTPVGFHSDWLSVVAEKSAKKLEDAVTLAEWEVQFLVGVVAGASWKGLTIVIGVDLFEESVTKKKTKATKEAIRAIQVLLTFRRELNPVAPVLTSVVFDTIWLTLLKGQAQYLPSTMANDPKVAARAAGTIAAQAGKKALEQKLTVSSIIWSSLSQLAIKGAMTIPAAAGNTVSQLTSKEPEAIVANLEQALRSVNTVLSEKEKTAIIEELKANPVKIGKIFHKMINDLKNPTR